MNLIKNMQVIVLAGGRGERLRPLTDRIPKPLVTVSSKPYLEIQLRYLVNQGLTRFILCTGYLGTMIEEHFGNGESLGASIVYSHEQTPLGTGGCLRLARRLVNDPVLVVNGDSFLPMDYRKLAESYESNPTPHIVVYKNLECLAPNNLRIEADRVVDCCRSGPDMNYIHAGVQVLPEACLVGIPDGFVSIEDSVYKPLIRQRSLVPFEVCERFYDIGTPERLDEFEKIAQLRGWA